MKFIRLMIAATIMLQFFSIQSIASNHVSVLCYHSFLGRNKVIYDFSLEELKSQLLKLRHSGYKFVSYKDIINGNIQGNRNILVTIDDGNRSVYQAYFQVFKPLGIKPLLAIYPFIIGRKEYALTWEQLANLSRNGCSIASHGYFHLKINNKLYTSDKKSFNREIFYSKKILEEKLKVSIDTFIYPFGLCTNIGTAVIKKAGYKYAFTIQRNFLKMPLVHNKDMLRLPRFMLTKGNHDYTIRNIVRKFGEGQQTIIAKKQNENKVTLLTRNDGISIPKQKSPENIKTNSITISSKKKNPESTVIEKNTALDDTTRNDIRNIIDFNRFYEYSNFGITKNNRQNSSSVKKHTGNKTLSGPDIIEVSNSDTIDTKTNDDLQYSHELNVIFTNNVSSLFMNHGINKRNPSNINHISTVSMVNNNGNIFQQRWGNLTRNVTSLYTRIIKLKHDRILRFLNRNVPQTASQ
ncbi:MAG TPA: polysaccharide deacetylase family protein [Spirochaetota bacterium]|nr:polysaccharide deacetylase family protein [Spirochaetota bacterium]